MEAVTDEVAEPIVWDGPIIAAMPVFNEEETMGSVVLSGKTQVDDGLFNTFDAAEESPWLHLGGCCAFDKKQNL